jgi:SAM-dependent methyltransferase
MNPIQKPCPICGFPPVEHFQAKWLAASKCGSTACGHIYAPEASIRHGVQQHPEAARDAEKYRDRNERLVRHWVDRGLLKTGGTVLDFGAGAGHIAMTIRRLIPGIRVICMEADPVSQAFLRANGMEVVGRLEECDTDFDAVLLVEVIEHIDAPVELLALLKSRLKPGGRIFLSTPCGELRDGSRKTNAYDTPEHIHFFTEQSLRAALNKAGFANIEFLMVSALYPRGNGAFDNTLAFIKGIVKLIRAKMIGYSHLVALVS